MANVNKKSAKADKKRISDMSIPLAAVKQTETNP